MKSDAHIHPFEQVRDLDRDSAREGMRAFVETARRQGFTEIAFTEHCPLLPWISGRHFATYVELTQEIIAETRDVKIYLGVEMDYHPRLLDKVHELLRNYPFDYVIGSVHIHTELYREDIEGKRYDEAIALAMRMNLEAVESGLFDTIAHLDFCRWLNDPERFGQWPGEYEPGRHRDAIMSILSAMESAGLALEINASGLDKRFASLMPCPEILTWTAGFEDLKILYGSDAHAPESVGQCRDEAVQALSPAQQRSLTVGNCEMCFS